MNGKLVAIVAAVGVIAASGVGVYYLLRSKPQDPGKAAVPAEHAVLSPQYKPRHKWRSVRGKHWQIISTKYESAAKTDRREGNRGNCPRGMVHVKGNMKLDPSSNPFEHGRIERMQLKTCKKWLRKEFPEACIKFDRKKWLGMIKELKTKPMEFCIDRYEYPNSRGQYPFIYVSWYESRKLCRDQGKRLCEEDEWTFACEGEDAMPYPTGYVRSAKNCIRDRHWRPYNEAFMRDRGAKETGWEMDRLWQGHASGKLPCKSPFGVYDLTGNVDEWTHTSRKGERPPSILKGGYWGPVRTRCRPTTRSHDENHTFYQQGFRCCVDAGTKLRSRSSDPTTAPHPRAVK